jgi:O-antigen/teichoic acid export membrane protein
MIAYLQNRLTPLLYSGSAVLNAIAQLFAGLLIIRWITPDEIGVWHSVRLAETYAFILLAGTNNGLSREVPFFLGKGDRIFSERLLSTALGVTTYASIIVIIIGIFCALVFKERGSALIFAILTVTLVIPLSFYQNVFIATYRSLDSFNKLTVVQFINASLTVITLLIVYFYGYKGMLVRIIILVALDVWLMYIFRPMKVNLKMDREALRLLIKTGLPIFGLDYIKNAASTIDRIVLLSVGGVKVVGLFALASVVISTFRVLPHSLSSYVYPRMTFKYGQKGDARELWYFGLKFVFLSIGVTGIAAIFGWYILPVFVKSFASKYIEGIHAAQIVLIAGILEGTIIVVNALWSMKAWKFMVTYQVFSSIAYASGPVIGVLVIDQSLIGVAWGVVIGCLFRSIFALSIAYIGTHSNERT